MKKLLLFLFSVSFCFSCFAQLSDYRYFIRFTDKNNSPYSISNPSVFLSSRALQRRTTQNIPVDNLDLPVNPQYLDSLVAHGAALFNASKWMNGVTVSVPDSATLNAILALPFVLNSTHVYRKHDSVHNNKFESIENADPSSHRMSPQAASTQSFSYGYGYNQIHQMNGEYLHDLGYHGEGMVISILDAGFYMADLLPSFDSLNADGRILGTWDFVHNEPTVYEDDAHGEAVLSCIAANMPDSLVGTAPKASFYLLISEDVARENIIEEYNWATAAEYADSLGTDVISSSLGYTTFDDFIFQGDTMPNPNNHSYADMNGHTCPSSIAADIAVSRGILVLTSAGNQGYNWWYYIGAPSDGDSVLCIGGVGQDGFHAGFSSYGPSSDGDVKPNVDAQGDNTAVQGTDGMITRGSGTSFSCPVLAGSATCLWQAHPNATAMEIHNAIQESASYALSPNDSLGYGIPNFQLAHQILGITSYQLFANDLIIYPNPVKDEVRFLLKSVKQGKMKAQLYDVTGKKIISEEMFTDGVHSNVIDGSELLSTGVYIMQVAFDGGVYVQRLMKM
jgi:serine protease AprX